MNHPLASYLKRFFSHYLPVQKGLSPHTLATYRDAVKLLLGYLADALKLSVDALSVEAITAARVSQLLDHLEQVRDCRTVTRNARLAAIRSLFALGRCRDKVFRRTDTAFERGSDTSAPTSDHPCVTFSSNGLSWH